jgi:hypothetical protein
MGEQSPDIYNAFMSSRSKPDKFRGPQPVKRERRHLPSGRTSESVHGKRGIHNIESASDAEVAPDTETKSPEIDALEARIAAQEEEIIELRRQLTEIWNAMPMGPGGPQQPAPNNPFANNPPPPNQPPAPNNPFAHNPPPPPPPPPPNPPNQPPPPNPFNQPPNPNQPPPPPPVDAQIDQLINQFDAGVPELPGRFQDMDLDRARARVAIRHAKIETPHVLWPRNNERRRAVREEAYRAALQNRVFDELLARVRAEHGIPPDQNPTRGQYEQSMGRAEFQYEMLSLLLDEEAFFDELTDKARIGQADARSQTRPGNIFSRFIRRSGEWYRSNDFFKKSRLGLGIAMASVGVAGLAAANMPFAFAGLVAGGYRLIHRRTREYSQQKTNKRADVAVRVQAARDEQIGGLRALARDPVVTEFVNRLNTERFNRVHFHRNPFLAQPDRERFEILGAEDLDVNLRAILLQVYNQLQEDRAAIAATGQSINLLPNNLSEAFETGRPDLVARLISIGLSNRIDESRSRAEEMAPWHLRAFDRLRGMTPI